MSLQEIKNELVGLCMDLQDELPKDLYSRTKHIRRLIIDSNQWIEKTAHLQLKTLNCLWAAQQLTLTGKRLSDIRWEVNRADGWMEEAIRIDTEERMKGIPKPLKSTAVDDPTTEWIEEYIEESDVDFVTSSEIYEKYCDWMKREEIESEALSAIGLGKKLGGTGFERTTRKIDGKAVKVWMITVRD